MALLALIGYAMVPRTSAYWELHSAATSFANYGLCMVGPTGPTLLRENPDEFWKLVRRRMVASDPDARPFERCVQWLDAFDATEATRQAHGAQADGFAEYAPFDGLDRPSRSIADLVVTTARLEALVERASPLSRAGFAPLVRPSRNARAVPHPADLPPPGWGRGLPSAPLTAGTVLGEPGGYLLVTGRDANLSAYRSSDGGLTWKPADRHDERVVQASGSCAPQGRGPAFRLVFDETRLRVESWLDGSLETSFPVVPSERSLVSFACDRNAAVVATTNSDGGDLELHHCRHVQRCRRIELPAPLRENSPISRFSVARIRGVMVVATSRGGIVRVVSSRDDGESWTPSSVAYDRAEYGAPFASAPVPHRLLAVERRLFLYAGSDSPDQAYPALVSDDFGASFHTAGEERSPSH